MVLPNPEPAAEAFSHAWWMALFVLLAFSVVFSGLTNMWTLYISRSIRNRDDADKTVAAKIQGLEGSIHKIDLERSRRDREHDEEIHALQLGMLQGKLEQCTTQNLFVKSTDHHGDIFRLEASFKGEIGELKEIVVQAHQRVDTFIGILERRWGAE